MDPRSQGPSLDYWRPSFPDLGRFAEAVGDFTVPQAANRPHERFDMTSKIKEHTCPACSGTGYPVVMQPVQPGRKIYPVKCKSCDGKGKVTDVT